VILVTCAGAAGAQQAPERDQAKENVIRAELQDWVAGTRVAEL
jgi:hypothetical protein